MISSRLRRHEEKNASRRIFYAIVGSIALLVFIGVFGLRILVGFSVLVDKLRGNSPASATQTPSFLIPPVLDPLPEATNSATITVSGKATAKMQLILYVNGTEYKKQTVAEDGVFSISDVPAKEGELSVSAKISDDKNNTSGLSNVISTTVDNAPPKLVIDKPENDARINDGTRKVTVNGMTDEDMKVTINGRIVVLKSDGSFSYAMPLNDGENKLIIISRDPAGNETTVERTVTYVP